MPVIFMPRCWHKDLPVGGKPEEKMMRLRHVVSALAGAVALAGTFVDEALAQRRGGEDWVELGCKEVSFRVDRDVLPVGRQEGRFYAIRLYARGGAVEMLNLRVIYTNGDPDNIAVRHILDRGERTRALDLRGRARSIRMIEMTYRALPNRRDREPIVCVEGLPRERDY
jgi:hypothetical protein